MIKHLLLALLATAVPGLAKATALDDALATCQQVQAQFGAASAIQSPSVNNFQSVQGQAGVLRPFVENLGSELSSLHVGPADQVRSLSASLDVQIGTLQGTTQVDVSAFINTCHGIASQMSQIQALIPALIAALQAEKSRLLMAVQTVTQWSPPTPVPGVASAGQIQPTPTPAPQYQPPAPQPAPTSYIPPTAPITLPGAGNPGILPGGATLPPPAPLPTQAPSQNAPRISPTPAPALRAPVAILSLSDGEERGSVYVANYNAGTVSVLDPELKRVVATIQVGSHPVAMAKSSEGSIVVVANYGSSTVTLIDSSNNSVLATVAVGSQPTDVAAVESKAYVVNQGSNSVTVVDLKRKSFIKNIGVGQQPSRISLGSESGRLYVTNTNEDSISILDAHFDTLVATVSE